MGIVHEPAFTALTDDPDDYRPSSSWAVSVDPDGRSVFGVVHERIGVGHRIPRHWDDEDRAIFTTTTVRMDAIARNPAPGTGGAPPMATTYDFATGTATVHGPTRRAGD